MARLTIPDEATSADFTVTTEQSVFPFSFAIFEKADLRVTANGLNVDQSAFTFAGTRLEGGGYQGGAITLNTPVTSGTVRVWRRIKPVRPSNFASQASVPVRSVDMEFNKVVAQQQDVMLALEDVEAGVVDPDILTGIVAGAVDDAGLLKADGSNISAPTMLAPSGALALRQSQNLFFVTPEDFGGVADDPDTDNSVAIARAETFLAGLPYRGELRFADGRDYYFKSTLSMNRPAGVWRGSLTRLIYNGASTTTDLVVFGASGAINTATELKDALMQGFQILSVTKMTAGTALRARKTIECHFAEVELQTQRGFETLGNNLWHGFWLEWGATVSISGLAYVCQAEAIRANGAPTGYSGGKSDLFIHVNKVSGAQVGLHVGGAFGGVYCSPHTTFIANTVHMIENNSINNVEFAWGAEANREVFAEGSVFDFTASAPDYAPNTGGPNIIIEGPGECLFTFAGCWIAGGYGANVWVRATSSAKVNLTGCRFFIANPGNASYPAAAALEGHSLAVGGTGAFVNVTGGSMHSYKKYGIYAASNGHGVIWNGVLIYSGEVGSEPVFRTPTTNAVGDYGNVRARTLESLGDAVVRGALFVGTAQQSFYTTANTRYHEFNANAFISYNTTDPQYQWALSGTADAMNLHPGGLSLLGQRHIAFKYVSGTTNGSGVGSAAHGIASLPARVVIAQAHVTEAGGDTKPFQMNTDGTNVGFTGATASRPWKGWIVYLRDAV